MTSDKRAAICARCGHEKREHFELCADDTSWRGCNGCITDWDYDMEGNPYPVDTACRCPGYVEDESDE